MQSRFGHLHSIEPALIKVVNDIHLNTDAGAMAILMPLDLSARSTLLTTQCFWMDWKTGLGFQAQSETGSGHIYKNGNTLSPLVILVGKIPLTTGFKRMHDRHLNKIIG